MASDEAKVRVRLDTRQAKGELRGLTKEGAKAGGRVGGGIRSALGRGMGMIGLGVGVGAGMAALRGPTQGGISAIVGQTLGPLGQQMYGGITGVTGITARARARALPQVIAAYGYQRGLGGEDAPAPQGAKQMMDHLTNFYSVEERGRQAFLSDTKFAGNDAAKKIDTVIGTMQELIEVLKDPKKAFKQSPFGPQLLNPNSQFIKKGGR